MDNLRWLLLGIGLLIIAAIYLLERYKRRRRRAVDRFFDEHDSAAFSMAPKPAELDDYHDTLADLGDLLARDRDMDDSAAPTRSAGSPPRREDALAGGDRPHPGREAEASAGSKSAAPVAAEPERLVILYLESPPDTAMHGTDLLRCLRSVDMTPGAMGIYHDLDSRNRPVFSVANMFEPGTLDVADPAGFTTRGLALFMCLPGPPDEQAAFDRMLAKAELLADKLGAVLHDDRHQQLTAEAIDRMRGSLKSAHG